MFASACSGASPGSALSIAVFNAEDFDYVDGVHAQESVYPASYSYAAAADSIATNAIDVIVFTEIQPYDTGLLAQELAARDISMTYRITTSNTSNPQANGMFDDEISIWSRFEITHFSQILRGSYIDPVSLEFVNAPRYILRACVDVGGLPVWFYGAHLKSTTTATLSSDMKRRRAQAHALEAYIKANHDPVREYIVVLGDMNTTDPSEFEGEHSTMSCLRMGCIYPYNTANQFTAVNYKYLPITWDGYGYSGGHSGGYTWKSYYTHTPWTGLLDHIILSPALYARYVSGSAAILMKNVTPRTSDHYPVMLKVARECGAFALYSPSRVCRKTWARPRARL